MGLCLTLQSGCGNFERLFVIRVHWLKVGRQLLKIFYLLVLWSCLRFCRGSYWAIPSFFLQHKKGFHQFWAVCTLVVVKYTLSFNHLGEDGTEVRQLITAHWPWDAVASRPKRSGGPHAGRGRVCACISATPSFSCNLSVGGSSTPTSPLMFSHWLETACYLN